MQFERSGKIDAPINKVFKCLTDINFLKSEISRLNKYERPKLHYDKKIPFGKGNKIILSIDGSQLVFQIEDCVEPSLLSINVFHGKHKQLFGSLFCKVNLESVGQKTIYKSVYVSEKTPNGIFSLIIKIYFWASLLSSSRRFNKYVQSQKNV